MGSAVTQAHVPELGDKWDHILFRVFRLSFGFPEIRENSFGGKFGDFG